MPLINSVTNTAETLYTEHMMASVFCYNTNYGTPFCPTLYLQVLKITKKILVSYGNLYT